MTKADLLKDIIAWSSVPGITENDITVSDYMKATGTRRATARRRLEALVTEGKLATHAAIANSHRIKVYTRIGE